MGVWEFNIADRVKGMRLRGITETPSAAPTASAWPLEVDFLLYNLPHLAQPSAIITLQEALANNRRALGLTGNLWGRHQSKPATADVPLSLSPTITQQLNTHFCWYDLFPFATMRDNMIVLSDVINHGEFLHDLFAMESFIIAVGCATWEPASWISGNIWANKWGFLFQDTTILNTISG